MSYAVVDTDVAPAILTGQLPDDFAHRLAARQPAITFVTVGDLTNGRTCTGGDHGAGPAYGPPTGPSSPAASSRVRLPAGHRLGRDPGHARLRGRPQPINDSRVAACCLARELPLATFNIKDYADFAEHEGLDLVL